jgi:carboxymethylenebutenolidase
MLHSSAGAFSIKSSNEPPEDNFGEKTLAQHCFAVVFPHYLEALGYKSMTSRTDIVKQFPALLAITEALLRNAEHRPSVKAAPVLLFGESLGAYLSVALALQSQEITAVSEISGGMPDGSAIVSPHTFSILISHGEDDTLVPVSEAYKLRNYCLSHNLPVRVDVYPRASHYIPNPDEATIILRTILFFQTLSK